jgi:hypothetical protein
MRLRTQGKSGENRHVAALDLGISQGTLNSSNTRIFADFNEILQAMNEYYPLFERRFKNNMTSLRELKSLSRQIRKSSS